MSETLIGNTIGKYAILEKLGRGGMAEVYKGYQENLDRFVAIKLMHAFLIDEQGFLDRFQREAKAMAALNHPNIVGVYDFDLYGDNTYYLVMEYIGGGTLKEKLENLAQSQEHLSLEEAIRIGREVADALAYAHRRNMVHRDIKPANIMMDEETNRAILTDFGIVKMIGGQSMAYTATGALIGTPAYMSPEQALGQSGDERVDIYSLGVLLFQMVTGQLPFEADTPLAVVMKHVNDPTPMPVTFNPDIPEALQAVILRAMAKIPENRYQTADEMVAALRAIDLSGASAAAPVTAVAATRVAHDAPVSDQTQAAPTAVVEHVSPAAAIDEAVGTAPTRKRSPWLYVGLVALLVLIAAGVIFGLGRGDRPEPTAVAVVGGSPQATTPRPTRTPEPAATTTAPGSTPDAVATELAAIILTETAAPTDTAVPTPTASPTKTPTPDATLAFLANCTWDAELVLSYAYQSRSTSAAPVGVAFPMHWVLKNNGSCPWPAGSQWTYAEGNELGVEEPVTIENVVAVDEEITLTADLRAPATVSSFDSTWQLVNAAGDPLGPPHTFSVSTYVPATPTPVPTDTPAATPTTEVEIVELNYAFDIQNCEYVGADWRCRVRLTPHGGGGGPYTMFIFLNPIVELRDQFFYDYFVQARRCAAWNTEIRVIDEATGLEMSRHLYVDPDDYIAGGCVE